MHVGQYRVRYRDVYSAGIVLNARYLDICDEAFTEFFRALGFTSADLSAGSRASARAAAVTEGICTEDDNHRSRFCHAM